MRSVCGWGMGLLLLVAAGQAQAQRAEIIGLMGGRTAVKAYSQADGGDSLAPVPATDLAPRQRVLEFNQNGDRARVHIKGQDVWLDRNALNLGSDPNAACHTVASTSTATTQGAGRSANSRCALPGAKP